MNTATRILRVATVAAMLSLVACAPSPPPPPSPTTAAPTAAEPPAAGPTPSVRPDRPPVPGDRAGVIIHTWRAISAAPLQSWSGPRTSLYTYVLVGDVGARGQDPNAATRRAWLALEQLLKEVQAGQSIGQDAARWPPEVLAQANQYCIPALASALQAGTRAGADAERTRVTLETYDVGLSRDHLNLFRMAAQGDERMIRSLSGVGPFLVATRKPLGEIVARNAAGALTIDAASPVLLIDMTGKHEKAMPAYVSAFQDMVRKDVVGRTSPGLLLESIGSALIQLGEAVPFVAEAHAGTTRHLLPR